jgi:cytochrome P450
MCNQYSIERTLFIAGCEYLKHLPPRLSFSLRPLDETSCNTLTFALYEIARNADIQGRLYAEVVEVLGQFSDTDTMQYHLHEHMPYLQAVIKETLRLHAVVAHGIFKAGKDDVIPLSNPICTPAGETINSVAIQKGQHVVCVYNSRNNCF